MACCTIYTLKDRKWRALRIREMGRWDKIWTLFATLMQTVALSHRSQSSAQSLNDSKLSMAGLWPQSSKYGAALVIPLSASSSALPRDHYHMQSISSNVRTKLSDGLARHGYYTATVYIGSPPQAFALIVDTGSTITYVPCSSCSHCGAHQDQRFKPEESSSYAAIYCYDLDCEMGSCIHGNNLCNYARHYAEESSSSGFLGRDFVRFGKGSFALSRSLLFGCETSETGELYSQHADGIMGLGRGSLSVVDQLNVQGAIASAFSLCYGGMDEDGGAMILGAIAPSEEMVFTPSNPSRSSYYNVVLREIWVQGEPLPVKPSVFDGRYGTILDSGTTFAYFPEQAFNVFKDAFMRGVKNLEEIDGPDETFKDICYAGAGNDLENLSFYFPSIDFVFRDNKMVSLAAENYLFRHTKHPGAYCLGFFQNEDPTTILGGIVVRNMLITYDRENSQIGFLRTKCTKLTTEPLASSVNNTSTLPPFGKADTDYEWNNPPMPLPPPHFPGDPHPVSNYPKSRWNHSEVDGRIPKKAVETSDASSSSHSPLFYATVRALSLKFGSRFYCLI